MNTTRKISKFITTHQLASFVALAIVIAAIMTVVSLKIYVRSGAIKLDLSRPGYEQVRQEVTTDGSSDKPFSPSGTLTSEALDDFRGRLDKKQADLKNLGNFGSEVLADSNLGLE